MVVKPASIRNFCIIAHVDHGKSTLADRLLETTQTVSSRKMREQFLDKLELERERGITIKLQAVRMTYEGFTLNLIDTPGHVDFSYEVTRSLAACEGAVLLVDATQGIQAQTLAHMRKAKEQGLLLIPVVNKIDLDQAKPEEVAQNLVNVFGFLREEVLFVSGKTGEGVKELLKAIISRIPPPVGENELSLRGLVFDSFFDPHKGVVALVRIFAGKIKKGDEAILYHSQTKFKTLQVGVMVENFVSTETLGAGEVGFVETGIKDIKSVHVGDTLTLAGEFEKVRPLSGYKKIIPLVFASLFPINTKNYKELRVAVEKLALNDGAFTYEPVSSKILGFGFKCGFLGLLHVDIIRERLERELGVEVLVTPPTLEFKKNKEMWVRAQIITRSELIGPVTQVTNQYRGIMIKTEVLGPDQIQLVYELPLLSIMSDFYDSLKSVTAGYASLEYETIGYKEADVVTLSVLVNYQEIDALSVQTIKGLAESQGRRMVERLKELIPRQQFKLPLQAAINGKVIARVDLPALKKDVTAPLYGGDWTRKHKLWDKQKTGKQRLKQMGQVSIPTDVFKEFIKGFW